MGEKQTKHQKPQPQDPSDQLFDAMFEFKMMAKSMQKESNKAKTQNQNLIKKVKDCIAKGDYEQAKTAASEAIRAKNMTSRYQVLSSKVGTIAQRLQSAYQNQQLTENMQRLTSQLLGAGKAMDLVKMTETMSNFEKLFDNLEVTTGMTDDVLNNISAGTVNEQEVNTLISQVAQQNGMKLSDDFQQIKIEEGGVAEAPQQQKIGADDVFPGL